jgi:hypothetical protein
MTLSQRIQTASADETTPEQIAGQLTEAQRAAIVNATDKMSSHGGFPYLTVRHTGEPWPVGIAEFLTLKTDRLTPLGLSVRAILKEKM